MGYYVEVSERKWGASGRSIIVMDPPFRLCFTSFMKTLFLFFVFLVSGVHAQRVALVVGNGDYQHGGTLPNAINDAELVSRCLEDSGFSVIKATNLGHEAIEQKLAEFGKLAKGAEAALFYFAGHGLEVGGSNFLIPVDAKVEKEFQVKHRALALDEVLGTLDESGAKVKLLYLDCCRNNPLGRSFERGGGGGLAIPGDVPDGTVLVFATAPKRVAFDGEGKNSPFTTAFVTSMAKGLTIEEHYKALADRVRITTNEKQQPWMNTNFTGNFSFLGTPLVDKAAIQEKQNGVLKAVRVTAPKVGHWRVTESVAEEHGGYMIVWDYKVSRESNFWVWTGQKVLVDGKKPTKGELAARNVMHLTHSGTQSSGSRVETNYRGEVLRGIAYLTFSRDGASFSGKETQGGELGAKLRGS